MYKFLLKKGTTIAFAVGAVITAITIIAILAGLSDFNRVPTDVQDTAPEGNIFLPGIYLTLFLLFLAVAVTIVMSVVGLLQNPKAARQGAIAFVVTLVVFLVLYFMADPKGTGHLALTIENFQISEGISKMITAGIQIVLVLTIGSVLVAVVMEGLNFFKNNR